VRAALALRPTPAVGVYRTIARHPGVDAGSAPAPPRAGAV